MEWDVGGGGWYDPLPAKLELLRTVRPDTIGVGKLLAEIAGEERLRKRHSAPGRAVWSRSQKQSNQRHR